MPWLLQKPEMDVAEGATSKGDGDAMPVTSKKNRATAAGAVTRFPLG